MEFSRRDTLGLGLGAVALTMLPMPVVAAADDRIAEFTGGADMADSGLTLTAPEIAELVIESFQKYDNTNIEGGDVLVIGRGSVLIGMSERTTPQGVENLAHRLFAA